MISAEVLLCILLHLNLAVGICERHSCTDEKDGSTIYFGLMLSYPDPLGRKALVAAFDDGHDMAPAAYLAVEQINNRSDLLTDYHVELLPLDGGCDVTERTVVGINNLACSCKPIVGIIGPSCGTSALIVGEFTGRDQFSMATIHYGEQNILGSREIFPFAFGILGANFINIQAFTDIIVWNNWTRIVLLYSEDAADLVELSAGIEQNLKHASDFDVAFTSPIYDHFIPLQEVRQSFARVIFILSSIEATLRTLCLAFHEGMIFPKYQWVFKERLESDFTEISFSYEGKHYFCTEGDISTSIYRSVNFVWTLESDGKTGIISGDLTFLEHALEYEEGYENQIILCVNEYNVSSMPVEWARGIYDAVWSLAFALNGSLNELSMDLTQILPGSKELAQAIADHMPDTDFQGVSGKIDFDNETGFNTARRINIYQFGATNSSTLIGFYTSEELVIFKDTTPQFIKSTFDEKHVQVSTAIAVPFLIIQVIFLLLILPIHVINIIYHNHSAIKASSPKLNHLIFLGFYLTAVGMMLYTITEAWPHTLNNSMLSNMCVILPWFLSIGPTLVLGTVCAKTWRLYYIYTAAKRGASINSKKLADSALIGFVGVFAFVDALLCLLWTSIDPPSFIKTVFTIKSEVLPTIIVTGSCQSTWLVYWTSALILYKCVLMVCSFFLALPTKLRQKEFKTNNVIVLSYILVIAVGLGIPIFAIISIVNVSVLIQFIVASVFLDTIIFICLFTLFFPSIVSFIVNSK